MDTVWLVAEVAVWAFFAVGMLGGIVLALWSWGK